MARDVIKSLVPSEYPTHLGRLGTYEVTGVVGVGGMGVVLKAIDPSLDRIVALKVMSPRLAHNENARKRFALEAKAAAAVLHPNVIPIHSVSSGSTLKSCTPIYASWGRKWPVACEEVNSGMRSWPSQPGSEGWPICGSQYFVRA